MDSSRLVFLDIVRCCKIGYFFGVIELTGWISARKNRHAKSALSLLPVLVNGGL